MKNTSMIDLMDVETMTMNVLGDYKVSSKLRYEYGNYIIYLLAYPEYMGGGYHIEAYTGFGEYVCQISKNAASAFCKALADYLESKKKA